MKKKKMNKIKEYLSNPATRVAFWVFIFWLWGAYTTLNSRISALEKQQAEMDIIWIQTTLTQIQTDIQWIKIQLQK